MKDGTLEHPKIKRLARILSIEKWQAIGLIESILLFARRYAIQGDIGKWSDKDLTEAIGWLGDPNIMMNALIEAGWLDTTSDQSIRLVIHDIKDHADNLWRECLEKSGLTWWDGSSPRKYKIAKRSQNVVETKSKRSRNVVETESKRSQNSEKSPESYYIYNPISKEGLYKPLLEDISATRVNLPSQVSGSAYGGNPGMMLNEIQRVDIEQLRYPYFPVLRSYSLTTGKETWGKWELDEKTLDRFKQTFPDKDVESECRLSWQWLMDRLDKPSEQKKNISRYLTNWLKRARVKSAQKSNCFSPREETFEQALDRLVPPTEGE